MALRALTDINDIYPWHLVLVVRMSVVVIVVVILYVILYDILSLTLHVIRYISLLISPPTTMT